MNHSTELPVLDTTGQHLYTDTDTLRAGGPAVLIQLPGGFPAWSVTRGPVIKTLATHPDVSKKPQSWHLYRDGHIPADWPLIDWLLFDNMLTADGEDHARLRALAGKAFTPQRVEALRPAIEAIVNDLITHLAAMPQGQPVDLRAAFSYQVPTRLICDIVGVPEPQRPEILPLIDAVLDTSSPTPPGALFNAIRALVETKRAAPGDDMTSFLLETHESDGDHLNEAELITTLITMIGAGSETAVSLLNHLVLAMLAHPDQLARTRHEPALWSEAIEESLRRNPPIMHIPMRFATADIDLGDSVIIREGDAILMGFGGHGRDPELHTHPDQFDIGREDKAHMAFGYGLHYCLGAPLAKLEATVALPALLDAFPHMRLAVSPQDLVQQPSFIGNDFTTLPILLHG